MPNICFSRRYLLKIGCDIRAKDPVKRTALHVAAEYDRTSNIAILLEHNSALEAKDANGLTPLASAAHRGHAKSVQLLLEHQADVNTSNIYGQRPLHLAAREDHEQTMQCLLEHGADIEGRDFRRGTPLLAAAGSGRRAAVRFLADQGADLTVKEEGDVTVLHIAVHVGDKAMVRFLLSRGVDIEAKTTTEWTPLIRAAVVGEPNIVALLLESGANVAAVAEDGGTSLHYAAYSGWEAVVDVLLQHNADLAAKNVHGQDAQSLAAKQGHDIVVKLLAEKTPVSNKVQQQSKAQSVASLVSAAGKGSLAQLKRLLDEGVDVNSMNLDGRRAISTAAENNQGAAASLLIQRGVDLNLLDTTGESALWWASRYGYEELVRLLLSNGASLSIADCDGLTPLFAASHKGHANVVDMLLKRGSDPNTSASYGKTPLLFAAADGHVSVVKALIKVGADVNFTSPQGETALSLANVNGHQAVVDLLEEHGAYANAEARDAAYTHDLVVAAEKGRLAEIYRLLELGANIDGIDNKIPIVLAAVNGQEAAVRALIARGAKVENPDLDGLTVMTYAAAWDRCPVITLLQRCGADLNHQCNEKRTPLSYAAKHGCKEAVEALLNLGARKEIKDKFSRTALWYATQNGSLEIVQLLIERGANIEAGDCTGLTPLSVASKQGNRALASLLLKKGARMRPESVTNQAPLCLAAQIGAEGLVDLLLDHGADINHVSDNRRTPLIIAATNGHNMVVKMLIEAGAETGHRDDDERTAVSYAKEKGHESIVKLLTQATTLQQMNDRAIKKAEQEGLIRRKLYEYRPLPDESYIRVLELQPGQANDIISFELMDVDLNKSPAFEALSYEWRDKFGTIPVQCGQDRLLITPNCKAALEKLRSESEARVFWIDAVCINQTDKKEVNQQVAMMTEIYKKARTVLMWLGQEGPNTAAALGNLTSLSEVHKALCKDPQTSLLDLQSLKEREDVRGHAQPILQNTEVTEGLRDLYWRPYFTRAWIFQEIIIAGERGVIMCGKHRIPWKDFKVAVLGYQACISSRNPCVREILYNDEQYAKHGGLHLGAATAAMSVLKASDPRDKIFATLRLAMIQNVSVKRPVADYTMTVQEVYIMAARYFTDLYQGVEIWQLGNRKSTKSVKNLPSWVPGFTKQWDQNPFPHDLPKLSTFVKGRTTTTPVSLHIDGVILDGVAFKLTVTKGTDAYGVVKEVVRGLADMGRGIYEEFSTRESGAKKHSKKRSSAQGKKASRVRFAKSDKDNVSARKPAETFRNTNGQVMLKALFESWGSNLKEDTDFAAFLAWKLAKDEEAPDFCKRPPVHLSRALEDWEARSKVRKDFDLDICQRMENRMRYDRDLVYTEKGYFGLTNGGEAEEDMKVALVGGDHYFSLLEEICDDQESWYEYVDRIHMPHVTKEVQRLEQLDKNAKVERLELR